MMRRALVWTVRGTGALVLLFTFAVGAGYFWLRGSLPQTEGTLEIAALRNAVEVLRDPDGIVTIRADSEHDAYVALGYVHAQDRLWQMDVMRRSGAGRLSEVMGAATLALDRFVRILGFSRLAEANLEHLASQTRAAIDAYTEGVNAFINAPGRPWPPEFYLLGYRPEPWRPSDSLLWGRLMALQLSGNWTSELLRLRLSKRLAPEQLAILWPPYPADAPVTLSDLAAGIDGRTLRGLSRLLPWALAPKSASNIWVVGGAHTATGKPLLANDPHLALTMPGTWYLVRIETPDFTLAGVTAPGVPFLILGHNGRIAWGFTTTESDTQDLFVERSTADDPGRYDAPGGPLPFETRKETVAVRDRPSDTFVVRETRHGPVISDAIPASDAVEQGNLLALAWSALREDDRTADAIYRLNHADDWTEFLAAMESFHSPQQNVVYADTVGTFGFIAPARVPVRKSGDGSMPVPGWNGAFDWTGTIPFDALPRAVNPRDGRIVNANNKVTPEQYPYLLTTDWPSPYRARRITDMIEALDPATVDSMQTIQLDVLSLGAADLLPRLLAAARPQTEPARRALGLLGGWDRRMARERPEPLIFSAWLGQLYRLLLADELGDAFAGFHRSSVTTVGAILSHGKQWCDDVTTQATEGCPAQVSAALEGALTLLSKRFGADIKDWRWGSAHAARFPHMVWSRVPVLGDWFGVEVATDGGNYTVNRGGMRLLGPVSEAFQNIHGPGLRAIYDLSDLDQSRFMIATGQSGNPLSPNYGSFVHRWRDGQYVKLVGDDKEPVERLVLNPR